MVPLKVASSPQWLQGGCEDVRMTWKTLMMTINMMMTMTMTKMMMMMMMVTMAVKREWKKVAGRTGSCSLHYWQTQLNVTCIPSTSLSNVKHDHHHLSPQNLPLNCKAISLRPLKVLSQSLWIKTKSLLRVGNTCSHQCAVFGFSYALCHTVKLE